MKKSNAPEFGHFIAINGHRFHEPEDMLVSLESVAFAVQELRSQPVRRRIRVIFFYNSPKLVDANVLEQVRRLDIGFVQHDAPSNGESLNLQISRAQEEGFDFYYRVDADDPVARDRFVHQAKIMEKREYDIVGGGLIYRNSVNGETFSVLPKRYPVSIDYLFNVYMLHATLAMDLNALKRSGLRYWNKRLEDKALGLAAARAKLRHYNAPRIYGEYNLNPKARSSSEAAWLNLKLNLSLISLRRHYWLIPVAFALFAANYLLKTQSLRKWRSRLLRVGRVRPGSFSKGAYLFSMMRR